MILSYLRVKDGHELLTCALDPVEFAQALAGEVVIPLDRLGAEAAHMHPVILRICGPAVREEILRQAVEMRDAGVDVRYRGRPGIPDE